MHLDESSASKPGHLYSLSEAQNVTRVQTVRDTVGKVLCAHITLQMIIIV